jgi:ABC-type phosphate transport system substrate-binding protein
VNATRLACNTFPFSHFFGQPLLGICNMKLNKLSLLCAVACAAFAGQASAQVSAVAAAKAIVDDANTKGQIFYISGASAVQGGLGQIATTLFSGTNYYFTPSTTSGRTASDYRAYAGKLAVAAGGWAAGSNVIIINRARGGSVQGVNPVARQELIESLVVTDASCAAGSGTSAAPFLCNTLDTRKPDAGVSDVAPALFHGTFNTEGEPAEPALNPSELATLTPTPLYGLAFGVPMSDNLPLFNINKATLSAIMTGNLATWNKVDATLPADDVLICRRVNGSGTQAVANLYYGNYPCDTATRLNAPADREAGTAWDYVNAFTVEGATGAVNVVENSSSGNVRDCLNNAFDASAKAFNAAAVPGTLSADGKTIVGAVGYTGYITADRAGNPVAVQFRDGNAHKAVGVLSMDSLSSSTATSKWTFRALDGAGEITLAAGVPATTGTGRLPTLASFTDGTWDMQGWISFNVPSVTAGNTNKAALAANFIAAAKSPAVLNAQTGLKFVAGAMPGTPDPTATGNVLRASYVGGDQCAPLNRNN